MSTINIDARNTFCPIPVIRVQDAVEDLEQDDIVIIVCTDRGALNDIPAWCRINGHQVIETAVADNEITVTVKVNKTE